MSIEDRLAATPPAREPQTRRQSHPTGPSFQWDGNTGFIQTGPLAERPRTWDEFIIDSGLDPEEVEVLEPVQVRGWDSNAGEGNVVRMHYYRLTVQRRQLKRDLDDLFKAARLRIENDTKPVSEDLPAFVCTVADLQLGKMDGDGVEGTVARFLDSTERSVARYKRMRSEGLVGPLHLYHLGDCIEGFVAMGGAQAWRTLLTTTEQVRLYRRLLVEQIKAFAPHTDEMLVAGIPGNHDEAFRPIQTYGDSWGIEAISIAQDVLAETAGYDHVKLVAPARDELTLTIDVRGTIVGLAHGHQWKGVLAENWLAKQALGRQPIGDVDLLFSGHLHHLRVIDMGPRTWIQVPAMESESTHFRHRFGLVSRSGFVTAVVGGGTWGSMEVI